MGKRAIASVIAALVAFMGGLGAVRAEAPALKWSCGPNARIEGNMLIADVPVGEEAAGGLARAEIDLSAWDGRPVGAEIVASGERIAKPLHWYNGLKFQFEYEDSASGELCYPNTPGRLGDFPEQTIHLRDFSPATRRKTLLVLGLQETSGHAAFDLSTLRIGEPKPLWPVTNQTHRCAYSDRIISHRGTEGIRSPVLWQGPSGLASSPQWGAGGGRRFPRRDGPAQHDRGRLRHAAKMGRDADPLPDVGLPPEKGRARRS